MERIELKDGLIKAYRYYEQTEELEIEFQDGRRAVHSDIARGTYEGLVRSDRPGAYWVVQIMRRGHKDGFSGHSTRWIGA